MTRSQMVEALRSLLDGGRSLADMVALAQTFCEGYGDDLTGVTGLLVDAGAPEFSCSVINTWNGGSGGRLSKFSSENTGIDAQNDCFQWILENTTFSFYEATTNQGFEIEYSEHKVDPDWKTNDD